MRAGPLVIVDRFHRQLAVVSAFGGVLVAGSVVWGWRSFWLGPGHPVAAALSAVALAGTVAAWLWLWARVWRTAVQFGAYGVVVRNFLHTDQISRPEVRCFADGSARGEGAERLWALRVVCHDGREVTAEGTARRKQAEADPGILAAVRQAAERHHVPAELTGQAVPPGPCPGPGGLPGSVREGPDPAGRTRRATRVAATWLAVTAGAVAVDVVLYLFVSTPGAILTRIAYGVTLLPLRATVRAYQRRHELRKLQQAAQAPPGAPAGDPLHGRPQARALHLSRRAAIVAGGVTAAGIAALVVAGFMFTSAPTSANQLTVGELQPGDCLAGSNMGLASSTAPWPLHVTQVACTQQHEAEVIFAGEIWPSSLAYPGDSRVDQQVNERCDAAFASYDGVTEVQSAFSLMQIAPDSGDWSSGDRSVQCIAYEPSSSGPSGGTPVDYSIKGSGK